MEDMSFEQPTDFEDKDFPNKTLYGLKQAPRA